MTYWGALALLTPLGLVTVVGLIRGYSVSVKVWRERHEEKDET